MTRYFLPGLAAALLCGVAAQPAAATTTIINITSADCAGGCSNSEALVQTLGDSALADVSHRSKKLDGTTYETSLKYWGSGYGDLTGVAWGGGDAANYRGEWVFTPAAGYEISLIGFDAGCYQNRNSCQTVNYTLTDLAGSALGGGSQATNWPTHTSVLINSAYVSTGIILTWGPDSYDVGLDNIKFDVRAIVEQPGGVPEPATWALLLGGFAIVGGSMRRRTVAVAFA